MDYELKDELYYGDLIYHIRVLAGFPQERDEEVEKRIVKREEDIIFPQEEGPFSYLNILSTFEEELFEIVRSISQKVGVSFKSVTDISKYPELVQEVLEELEQKKSNVTVNQPVITEDEKKLCDRVLQGYKKEQQILIEGNGQESDSRSTLEICQAGVKKCDKITLKPTKKRVRKK